MTVSIPSHLRAYTRGAATVTVAALATGAAREPASFATVADVLAALDRRGPGFRFRIVDELGRLRPHIRVFVQGRPIASLAAEVADGDELFIAAALSGG